MARDVFAHDAVVVLAPDGDPNALGGAVTRAVCGHWNHPPPCPLAAHHTAAVPEGETIAVRVLFATEPANAQHIRRLIGDALATGRLTGPDGRTTEWQLQSEAPGDIRPDDQDRAARLIEHVRA